jgi:SEL1 protein
MLFLVEEADKYYRYGRDMLRELERERLLRADGSFLTSAKAHDVLKKALYLFTMAFKLGHKDATYILAENAFWGTYQPHNHTLAKEYYTILANKGNATAHQRLGFLYSWGLKTKIEPAKVKKKKIKILSSSMVASYASWYL